MERGFSFSAARTMLPSVESQSLIVEEAALVLDQERRLAIDATRLFSGCMILG
jgi:hypothetical protein